ncbi:MAG: hypothetical protein LBU24_00045 [Methanocalculaceae archaeon]|jgi:hypothetical protein|nr:hypothetical protein [Methanocalculaceae archaeon]
MRASDIGKPALEAYAFEIVPVLAEIEILEKSRHGDKAANGQDTAPSHLHKDRSVN